MKEGYKQEDRGVKWKWAGQGTLEESMGQGVPVSTTSPEPFVWEPVPPRRLVKGDQADPSTGRHE